MTWLPACFPMLGLSSCTSIHPVPAAENRAPTPSPPSLISYFAFFLLYTFDPFHLYLIISVVPLPSLLISFSFQLFTSTRFFRLTLPHFRPFFYSIIFSLLIFPSFPFPLTISYLPSLSLFFSPCHSFFMYFVSSCSSSPLSRIYSRSFSPCSSFIF